MNIDAPVTILWLSGWSMSEDVFSPLMRELSGCQHVCPSFAQATSVEAFDQLAAEAIQGLDLGQLIIIGWSLGGIIAQKLAAVLKPRHLLLIGSTACFVRPKTEPHLGWADAYLRQMQQALKSDRATVISTFHQLMFTPDEQVTEVVTAFSPSDRWTQTALIEGLNYLRQADVRSLLATITCPVQIIHGTTDLICPYKAAEEMKAQLPHARLVTLENGGHVPFLTREKQLAGVLREVIHESL